MNQPWKKLGITQALYYIRKRQAKSNDPDFGCVVCGGKKKAKSMCNKHYQKYYRTEINKRSRKGIK